ncbi:uncharacterized protein LOC133142377 isoform X2 [Conger conger]|uniref:uncharacterized protein LOC133142377 isoform X2 n=1 Tax=Conger conger TaxID=82655 RepID=UPI002A5A1F73|nr:uncharacterized protein LOC133142377 isoform X2 [Conger conger]
MSDPWELIRGETERPRQASWRETREETDGPVPSGRKQEGRAGLVLKLKTGSLHRGSSLQDPVSQHRKTHQRRLRSSSRKGNLQLIGLHEGQWSNVGLKALLKGPTAALILLWLHRGLNHQPSGSQSGTSAARRVCHSETDKRKDRWTSSYNLICRGEYVSSLRYCRSIFSVGATFSLMLTEADLTVLRLSGGLAEVDDYRGNHAPCPAVQSESRDRHPHFTSD